MQTNRFLHNSKHILSPGFDLAISKDSNLFESSPSDTVIARNLPTQAERILDAPDLLDDYYLNLLDWSSLDTLGVALDNSIYAWHNGEVREIINSPVTITSLSWMPGSHYLAVGDSEADLSLYDAQVGRKIRVIHAHADRISSLSWKGSILSSGSRDSTIIHHDMRAKNFQMQNKGHFQEVCGLKWSEKYLASGGNDNHLNIWEIGYSKPIFSFNEHKAAVKALAWCPYAAGVLASGGGSADQTIKLWDVAKGVCSKTINTGSQVCALEWNKHDMELLSAHGFADNQLTVWKYPQMQKLGDVKGHTARVLYLAQNPEGDTVVSAGADETIRFWKIFKKREKNKSLDLKFSCR
ncbi:unnamed protein product [Blepharisma stoltei]|uniref:CDC20/Fizzy WD40 domain-containing protein n=1 Tax=Blepharisma stoltei TaxID=1481888 RepID=A0AAU9J0W8_9CILI|nr:unnamed protein product [Blepharisma stoltei]